MKHYNRTELSHGVLVDNRRHWFIEYVTKHSNATFDEAMALQELYKAHNLFDARGNVRHGRALDFEIINDNINRIRECEPELEN